MKDLKSIDIVTLPNLRMWTLKPDNREQFSEYRRRVFEPQSCFAAISSRRNLAAGTWTPQHDQTSAAATFDRTSERVVRLRTRLHDEHDTHSDLRAILFLVVLVTVCCGLAGSIMHIW